MEKTPRRLLVRRDKMFRALWGCFVRHGGCTYLLRGKEVIYFPTCAQVFYIRIHVWWLVFCFIFECAFCESGEVVAIAFHMVQPSIQYGRRC